MQYKYAKIVVFTPVTHAEAIRQTLGKAGAGHIGNYDYCSFSTTGIGRYRPREGSNPYRGKQDTLETVEEEKIETICPANKVQSIVKAVQKTHPYEEPAIDIYPLLNI
ncbi:hypothetical protein GF369_00795 [Candidatus Peregrinibacteria bacterium]|nr:hypothetical protein [Candidatus Peregrinibacteria bacterium]